MKREMKQEDQGAPPARPPEHSEAARQIAEYEAEVYKQKRDLRAARKSFKPRLSR